jgi:microcystin-dependent protein
VNGFNGVTCYIGQVLLTAGPFAPGYKLNGQYLNRTQEPVLFDVIGTTFGDDPNNSCSGALAVRAHFAAASDLPIGVPSPVGPS